MRLWGASKGAMSEYRGNRPAQAMDPSQNPCFLPQYVRGGRHQLPGLGGQMCAQIRRRLPVAGGGGQGTET